MEIQESVEKISTLKVTLYLTDIVNLLKDANHIPRDYIAATEQGWRDDTIEIEFPITILLERVLEQTEFIRFMLLKNDSTFLKTKT